MMASQVKSPASLRRRLLVALVIVVLLAGVTLGYMRMTGMGPWAPPPAKEFDVVVVGAGLAGLSGAVAAAEAGARVALLEKMAFAGGNSALATGIFQLADTSIQRRLGVADSADAFFRDTMDISGGRRDPVVSRLIADRGAEMLDWLIGHGAQFEERVTAGLGSPVLRAHRSVPDGSGPIAALVRAAEGKGVEIFYETPAVSLLTNDAGRVIGVEAVTKAGQILRFHARNVILATGGYAASPERLARYTPAAEGVIYAGAAGTTGEMLDEALRLGADTIHMDVPWLHPTIEVSKRRLITGMVLSSGAVLVDSEGRRFFDEVGCYTALSKEMLAREVTHFYQLFDARVRDMVPLIPRYIEAGLVTEAATWQELAAKIDVPAANLTATIEAYNRAVRRLAPDPVGRSFFAHELATAPFYSIRVNAGTIMTGGGLRTNADSQVLHVNGTVIPGLYAAGEIVGGYRAFGYRAGDSLSHAAVTGRIAGAHAARR